MLLQTSLQIFGGVFYLLQKILLWQAERTESPEQQRSKRIWSWIVYLIGLPPIVALLWIKDDLIVAAVEAGGGPAMVMGLIAEIKNDKKVPPAWLDWIARIAVVVGLVLSWNAFGGLTTLTQALELMLAAGFLIGTYLLAAKRYAAGYAFFFLMNFSCGTLMFIQELYFMAIQQVCSIYFIVAAYNLRRRKAT